MKIAEKYFPMVLFLLYKVALAFESVVEILKCYHSNESYWATISCGAAYYHAQGCSTVWVSDEPLDWKLRERFNPST